MAIIYTEKPKKNINHLYDFILPRKQKKQKEENQIYFSSSSGGESASLAASSGAPVKELVAVKRLGSGVIYLTVIIPGGVKGLEVENAAQGWLASDVVLIATLRRQVAKCCISFKEGNDKAISVPQTAIFRVVSNRISVARPREQAISESSTSSRRE